MFARQSDNANIKSYHCWICDLKGIGSLEKHECNLKHLDLTVGKFLATNEGQFLTFMAQRMIHASNEVARP